MPQIDLFENRESSMVGPATRHFQITPNDDEDLPYKTRAIRCQAAGTIVVRDEMGVDLPYLMVDGDYLVFRAVRVLATGTSGTFYGWT